MLLFTKMENEKAVVDNVQDVFNWYCGRAVLKLCEAVSVELGLDLCDDKHELDMEQSRTAYSRNLAISFSVPKELIDKNGIFCTTLRSLSRQNILIQLLVLL